MVWHFFKKDFRLLWPMALALAAAQALCAARTRVLGHFNEPAALYRLTSFLPIVVFLGVALVTISAVHQNPLPGVRQDWLTRPVRRRDVWLSKVLFVVLLVVTPIFTMDIVEGLSVQLPLRMSIAGAASRALLLLGGFALPALVVGAVTRSFTEALVVAIVAAVALDTIVILGAAALPPGTFFVAPAGMQWVALACASIVMTVAAAVTLWFQHTYRRTGSARVMAMVGALMTTITMVALPVSAAMQIQRWTWGSTADAAITVHFAPDSQATPGEPAPRDPGVLAAGDALMQEGNGGYTTILIPMRIEGIARGNLLQTDQLRARITAADGAVIYDDSRICLRFGSIGASCRMYSVEIHSGESSAAHSLATAHVGLPNILYQRVKNQAVNMELGFSLTSFAPDADQVTGTHSDVRQLSHLGSCATRIDADGDEVELRCLTGAKEPPCIVARLEDPQTQKRNPAFSGCRPDYAPFRLQLSTDAVSQIGLALPFRDPSGLAQFPVDASAIDRAQVRLTTFTPVSHFRRSLSIPNVRLADWEASRESALIPLLQNSMRIATKSSSAADR